jgi:hypothetical protein
VVRLFLKGEQVGHFSFPAADPRFVKDDDLFRIAFAKIQQMQNSGLNRRNSDPKEGHWDTFEIWGCASLWRGNVRGERITENRADIRLVA